MAEARSSPEAEAIALNAAGPYLTAYERSRFHPADDTHALEGPADRRRLAA